jgi:hypothetical protein
MSVYRLLVFAVVLMPLGCGCLSGCGRKPQATGPVPTYPVTGTVTYQGKPLAEATVIFRLKEGTYSATGRTDAQGKYKLSTFNPGDGAPAGEYVVAIVALESVPAEEEEKPVRPPKSLIPEKYSRPETSGLTALVKQEANVIDFNL